MKIFSTSQVKQLDKFTIENEPITSINLMERAANALYNEFLGHFPYHCEIVVCAGFGNNGGDALALARKLVDSGYDVKVVMVSSEHELSHDCNENFNRCPVTPMQFEEFKKRPIPFEKETIIIDGLFGSGLNRPLEGIFAEAVQFINNSGCQIVAIDIPSGLGGEECIIDDKHVVKADYTFSLQFPKLAFLFAENETYVGRWSVLNIDIHPQGIAKTPSHLFFVQEQDLPKQKRSAFGHKGTYGHVLIIAGSKGMAGSSVLAAKAALMNGCGLVTVHGPKCNRIIVQTAFSEAMYLSDENEDTISKIENITNFDSLVIGPGLSVCATTENMLEKLLLQIAMPSVIDADALNILSLHKDWLKALPKNCILTPHPKEFERLFGKTSNSLEQLTLAKKMATEYQIIIVLKGAYTRVVCPDGRIYFNSTGNPGMATAGAGDVLSGIIGSMLAQGYKPCEAAVRAVYLHGKHGDNALEHKDMAHLIAEDLI